KQPDFVFFNSGGNRLEPDGPGDGKSLHKVWKMDHNWREARFPRGGDIRPQGWIPPTADDVRQDSIDDINRAPDDVNFLRPAKDSALATKGAGQTDPWRPSYGGALRPEGVEPGDWNRTWKAEAPGRHQLLTVSKKQDG